MVLEQAFGQPNSAQVGGILARAVAYAKMEQLSALPKKRKNLWFVIMILSSIWGVYDQGVDSLGSRISGN